MKIDIVGIFGIVFAVVLIVSIIWIRNLYNDTEFYKSEINNYCQNDKTFIVVKYQKNKDLKAEIETIKLAPKESYGLIVKPDVELLGVTIVREN